ncbi:MAG: fibronectin type III domain-containing protein [Minisyncoccia bacterium]
MFLLVFSLGLGSFPFASYARDNDDSEKREDKSEKIERSDDKSCRKMFRRLFLTAGFFRNRENINLLIECLKPFGIEAKFVGTASTTPTTTDNTPPIISTTKVSIDNTKVNLSWKTNENATSRVYYGTSASLDVNASSTSFVESASLKKNHNLTVSNLASSTAYYMAIESKDGSGNKTVTSAFNVNTLGL